MANSNVKLFYRIVSYRIVLIGVAYAPLSTDTKIDDLRWLWPAIA